MDGIDRNDAQVREANELYWESETSVNQIANRLGLSKGSLYAAIEPLASESFCPLCTARLVYLNRTAHEKGHLQCSKCGTEFTEKGRSGPTRRLGTGVGREPTPRQPAPRQPALRQAASQEASRRTAKPRTGQPRADQPRKTEPGAVGSTPAVPRQSETPTTPAPPATAATPDTTAARATPAQPAKQDATATRATPATNGSHLVTAEDERASRQLVLSTAMLSLGVGLLLARVLRR